MDVGEGFRILSVTLAFSVLAACVGVDKRTRAEVDQKVAAEEMPRSRGELSTRGFDDWAKSTGLNDGQKLKMADIQVSTEREALNIRDEINRSKSALFKELAKGNYDDRMIDGFKSKIVKLDHDRLELMFKALVKVRTVLGRSEESKRYFEYMEMIETRDMAGPRF